MNDFHYPGEELRLFAEARNWKKYLSKHIRPYLSGEVLEVGAGNGATTPYLVTDQVTKWICLEPDNLLFAQLEKNIQDGSMPPACQSVRGTIDDFGDAHVFDVIIYLDVIEHIENDNEEIRKAVSKLKIGGRLIILAPAFQALYSYFDKTIGHHRRYNKKMLRQLVSPHPLRECRLVLIEISGMLPLLFNRYVFKKRYPSTRDIRIWDKLLVPLSTILDKIFLHSLGKSIIGVWEKQASR